MGWKKKSVTGNTGQWLHPGNENTEITLLFTTSFLTILSQLHRKLFNLSLYSEVIMFQIPLLSLVQWQIMSAKVGARGAFLQPLNLNLILNHQPKSNSRNWRPHACESEMRKAQK